MNDELKKMKDKIISLKKAPVIFVGSGITARYYNTPNWAQLLEMVAEKINVDKEILDTCKNNEEKASELEYHAFYMQKPDYEKGEGRRTPLRNVIKEIIESKNTIAQEMQDEVDKMSKILPEAIITTNYDTFLEQTFSNRYDVFVGQDTISHAKGDGSGVIYKIHGCVTKPSSIVITKEDYFEFMEKEKYLYAKLITLFWENPIVFMGYSITDPNVKNILDSMLGVMSEEQKEEFRQRVWVLSYSEKEESFREKEFLTGRNSIRINSFYLNKSYGDFYQALSEATEQVQVKELKFSLSDNAINLLIKPLYQSQDKLKVMVRELLQNAQDACKKAGKEIRVDIELLKNQEEWTLKVADYGIGMDRKDMEEYLLTIGKSSKVGNDCGMTGKFGIGILSVFLVGKVARIYSVKNSTIPVGICIYDEGKEKKVRTIQMDEFPCNQEGNPATIIEVEITDKDVCEKIEYAARNTNGKSLKPIIEALGLENYYVWEGVNIQINFQGECQKIEVFSTEDMKQISDSFYIGKIYNGNTRAGYERGKALINDMMVHLKSNGMGMAKSQDIPFFAIRTNQDGYGEEIEPNLDRSVVQIKGKIEKEILSHIYEEEVEQLLAVLKNQIMQGKLLSWQLYHMIFSFCNVLSRCHLGYINGRICFSKYRDDIVEIYTHTDVAQRITGIKYCKFRTTEFTKKELGDMIEYGNILGLGEGYLEEYIINATGPHSGFRKEVIERIFRKKGIACEHFTSANHMWGEINKNKEELRARLKCENGILWFDDVYRPFINPGENFPMLVLKKSYMGYVDSSFLDILKNRLREEPELEKYIEIKD